MSEMPEIIKKCFSEFSKTVTVPILVSKNNGGIDQVGTGTLFSISDRIFLITARHIFDDYGVDQIAMPSNPIRDPSPHTLGSLKLYKPDDEAIDVAAVEIEDLDTLNRVRHGWRVLGFDDIASPSKSGQFVLSGYPSIMAVQPREALIGSTLLSFHTEMLPDVPATAKAPVHPDLDLFFAYGVQAELSDGSLTQTPHLGGASGASIWEYKGADDAFWTPQRAFKVVGVQSTMSSGHTYFRGKSWTYVLELLGKCDPTLKAAVSAFRAMVSSPTK